MDIYKVKWTRLQAEIFRFLCIKSGQTLNARTIARALKKSPTAITSSLKLLEKENLIKIKRSDTMNLLAIEFNRDNEKAIKLKRVENLKIIYESNFDKYLHDSFPGSTIILFGSYSRGEDISTYEHKSDIDIAIIGAGKKQVILESIEKILEKKIIINFYSSFKDIHKNLKDNLLNGIVLSGSVDL